MIEIAPGLSIDENELQFDYVRASGPGGQNVNKVSTAVQLRFDARSSPGLSADMLERLQRLAGSRMTSDGVIIIEARSERTQEQNRADALQRLVDLLRQAARPPRLRRATRPTAASQARRLEQKRIRGKVKQERRGRRTAPEE